MADVSRDLREHWFKPNFSKNEVANSGLVVRAGGSMPELWATMVVYVVVICIGSALRWRRGRWRSIRLVQ